jgi:hypothetical protein
MAANSRFTNSMTVAGAVQTKSQTTFVGGILGESRLRRFLVGPKGAEVTGITETADGKAFLWAFSTRLKKPRPTTMYQQRRVAHQCQQRCGWRLRFWQPGTFGHHHHHQRRWWKDRSLIS